MHQFRHALSLGGEERASHHFSFFFEPLSFSPSLLSSGSGSTFSRLPFFLFSLFFPEVNHLFFSLTPSRFEACPVRGGRGRGEGEKREKKRRRGSFLSSGSVSPRIYRTKKDRLSLLSPLSPLLFFFLSSSLSSLQKLWTLSPFSQA